MVSRGEFGKLPEPDVVKCGSREGFEGWGSGSECFQRREIVSGCPEGVVVRGVERAQGRNRRCNRLGKSQGVSPSHGSAELSSMDEGEDILRESIIVSCMKDATRGPMNGEKGLPVSR